MPIFRLTLTVREFWLFEFEKYSAWLRSEATSPILNKVGQFLTSIPLRNVVGQKKNTFRLRNAMDEGPLAREPVSGIKVSIVDAKLHEDNIHRGPAQVIPAVRRAIRQAMVGGKAFILEPKQVIRIDVPTEQVGGATKEVNNRRGSILEMTEERGVTSIKTKLPVAEMFGFNSALKSATGGLGFFWLVDVLYEPIPRDLEPKVIEQIKSRKGIRDVKEDEEEDGDA